jgi:hypothetical protein
MLLSSGVNRLVKKARSQSGRMQKILSVIGLGLVTYAAYTLILLKQLKDPESGIAEQD